MRLSWLLMLIGGVLVGGYLAYVMTTALVGNEDIPLAVRIGVPAIALGALLLFGIILMDRVQRRLRPEEKEIEEARP